LHANFPRITCLRPKNVVIGIKLQDETGLGPLPIRVTGRPWPEHTRPYYAGERLKDLCKSEMRGG